MIALVVLALETMAGWSQSRILQGIVEDVVARFRRLTILCQPYGREKAKVHIGHARVCYVVPKKLLYERSSYFRSVFTGGFEEASASEPELPHIEAETFQPVVKWMMSGIIEVSKKKDLVMCAPLSTSESTCFPSFEYTSQLSSEQRRARESCSGSLSPSARG